MDVLTIREGQSTTLALSSRDLLEGPAGPGLFVPAAIEPATGQPDGTTILLGGVNVGDHRQLGPELGRRFAGLLSHDFSVTVGGYEVEPPEVPELAVKLSGTLDGCEILPTLGSIKWWMGGAKSAPTQGQRSGISIVVRGVEVGQPFLFFLDAPRRELSRVVGIVEANQLDGEFDLLSLDRQSVLWNTQEGAELLRWGQSTLHRLLELWRGANQSERSQRHRGDAAALGAFERSLADFTALAKGNESPSTVRECVARYPLLVLHDAAGPVQLGSSSACHTDLLLRDSSGRGHLIRFARAEDSGLDAGADPEGCLAREFSRLEQLGIDDCELAECRLVTGWLGPDHEITIPIEGNRTRRGRISVQTYAATIAAAGAQLKNLRGYA